MDRGLHLQSGRIELADGERSFRLEVDDFRLVPGQAVALTGASGSGKTLLLELLGLLRAPARGAVYRWEGEKGSRDLAALWAKGPRGAELARMRGALFGFVPQTGGLVPFLSVTENVSLPQKGRNGEERTEKEQTTFKAGLDLMGQLYGSLFSSTVLQIKHIPSPPKGAADGIIYGKDGAPPHPYDLSGWCADRTHEPT